MHNIEDGGMSFQNMPSSEYHNKPVVTKYDIR